ncbi:MAG TPA: hypothetical protein VMT03_20645 [Polyangia bacterium]|nr:hypothetical protein [Polyangia bacterium]
MSESHRWTFFRAGGFDQVKLASGADLRALRDLDQKLWAALACPISGLEMDARTMALIDTDKDGRVRAPELLAAIDFACSNLKSADVLLRADPALPLSAIDDGHDEGKALVASARRILGNIGRADALSIAVEDVADPVRIFANTLFNGDGVISQATGEDEPTRALIGEIITCMGGLPDRSGATGINGEMADGFFGDARALSDWYAEGEADAARVFPLGPEATRAAAAAVAALKAKIDDYFARCRLAAFDPRAGDAINGSVDAYAALAAEELSATTTRIAELPLALAAPARALPLSGPVNPAHAAALASLRTAAIEPLLGPRAELTEADWRALLDRLAAHDAWQARKPTTRVEPLGVPRVRAILASSGAATVADLLARDKALEPEAAYVEKVERLVRYHRDLARLCTNFVSFEDFYGGVRPAIFQFGTLYLDGRACRLCLRVGDPAKHATMAGLAGAYLAYLDCVRPATGEKAQIVAAFTAGDSDNLMIGRNGIFYDRAGRDWDATITKVVDNPISIRQAFWSPYKKFVRLLEEQVAKRAAAADAVSQATLGTAATSTANIGNAKAPEVKKIDVGTVAALGVAIGAIGTFATALIAYATGILRLGVPATVGALLGIILLISMPSVVLAYIKLRKRNLAPILDANGWAVNIRARINVPFGASLSSAARLPPGATRDTRDRYAEHGFPWRLLLVGLAILYGAYIWSRGNLDSYLPRSVSASHVLHGHAPAR